MPELGAGSTDLMLLTIIILGRVVVEKVCRVDCGAPYDVYASIKAGRYLGTLQTRQESNLLWRSYF